MELTNIRAKFIKISTISTKKYRLSKDEDQTFRIASVNCGWDELVIISSVKK